MNAPARSTDVAPALRDAIALEAAGGDWRLRHVCAVLDCHRSTLYRAPWRGLLNRAMNGPGGLSFHPSDVRLFQANVMRATRRAHRPTE